MLMFTIINLRSKWIKIAFGGVVIIGLLISLPYFFGLHKRLSLVTQPEKNLLPIYYVETPEKKIAISFDASWGGRNVPLKFWRSLKDMISKQPFSLPAYG